MNNDNKLEDFINKIDYELTLRKKQLNLIHEIYSLLSTNNHKFTFIRVTIPELYAHYEGFLKFIFIELIDYLKSIQIPNSDIDINYLIFPLLTNLEDHIVSQKTRAGKILNIFNSIFKSGNKFLDMANLDKYIINHDTVQYTFDILGINVPENALPLDNLGLLYNRRNAIAHGELKTSNQFSISKNSDISDRQVVAAYDIWKSDYACILASLDVIKDIIVNYVVDKEYIAV